MLDKRSRVKTGCGLYALKCTKIKKIVRDMWTEVPPGAILESTYYRYLNFYEDGRVLYALTSKPPYEMIPIFIRVKAGFKVGGCSTVFGSYQIQKDVVTVDIQHPWHHVKLVLRVLEDGAPMAVGKFWALQFEKHQSSANNDFDEYWSRDLVNYDVPTDPFRFLRNWKL
jgi:F-box protein 9